MGGVNSEGSRTPRTEGLCQERRGLQEIPGRHGVQFSYRVMGSLKTEV